MITGWHSHFSKISKPPDATAKEKNVLEAEFDELVITQYCKDHDHQLKPITEEETTSAIATLNTKKSPDCNGLTAEHIKHGGHPVVIFLTMFLNAILQQKAIPDVMKTGILSPIYKKKGDRSQTCNYRGITVTPVITKLLEKVLRKRIQPLITNMQHPLQFGFTETISPICSALVLQEAVLESKSRKLHTYAALLDAKAAFDTVNHEILFRKLFLMGMDISTWLLVTDIQRGAETRVKWANQLSDPIQLQQGVRQGGVLSADLYKVFINNLLGLCTTSGLGTAIGNVSCASPTCADDVALIATSEENLQGLLDIAGDYSTTHSYLLQPRKSMIITNDKDTSHEFKINQSTIPISTSAVHLGIYRDSTLTKAALTVAENLKKARRATYSLLGAGLHGINGINPKASIHLIETYIVPILIYGTDSLMLTQGDIDQMETFYRKILKQILSLPDRVAQPAPYILLGVMPIEARIHLQILTLIRNICSNENSILHDLCIRQMFMKGLHGKSWFSEARKVLAQYDLPSLHSLLNKPPSKYTWKKMTKRAVTMYWNNRIQTRAKLYPSLRHLVNTNISIGTPHPAVSSVSSSHTDIRAVPVQLRILTRTYILQSNRAAFNQHQVNPDCVLCKRGAETYSHFLVECRSLVDVRDKYLRLLLSTLCSLCQVAITASSNIENLAEFIIDPSVLVGACCLQEVERNIRRYLYTLHHRRKELMDILSQ